MPFLENVTRGRDIPRERLAAVAEHYLHFGGVSPINGINRALIGQLEAELVGARPRSAGVLRQPQLGAVRRRYGRGHARQRYSPGRSVHHVGVGWIFQLHAVHRGHRTRSSSGWRSRTRARQAAPVLRPSAVRRDVRRRASRAAAAPADGCRDDARLVFTAHSIPVAARSRCGTDLYARQVAYASRLVATAAGYDDYDQVWQSRSGPPHVPWLEPDVADHLSTLAERAPRR